MDMCGIVENESCIGIESRDEKSLWKLILTVH